MKTRTKKKIRPVPTRAEMEALVERARDFTITLHRLRAQKEVEAKQLDARYAPVLEDASAQLDAVCEEVKVWADHNQAEFGKNRSLTVTHGLIGWRQGQPALKTLAGWTWGRVLALLKTDAPRYVRTKEEVNKQAIIADRERVVLGDLGVKITQDETFFVEPKLEEPGLAK